MLTDENKEPAMNIRKFALIVCALSLNGAFLLGVFFISFYFALAVGAM